jgi:hypothetical protein
MVSSDRLWSRITSLPGDICSRYSRPRWAGRRTLADPSNAPLRGRAAALPAPPLQVGSCLQVHVPRSVGVQIPPPFPNLFSRNEQLVVDLFDHKYILFNHLLKSKELYK